MNISNDYAVMIFKSEYEGKTFYKVGLSKKNQDKSYTKGYMPVRFKKDVVLEDKTKIYIKNAWLDFYLKDKATIPYIFISEFQLLEDAMKESKEETPQNYKTNYQETITISEDELPF